MIEIIPAIDVIGGECVRLTKGVYDKKTVYFKDPVDAAMAFEDAGLRRLHLVDLDGAKESRPANLKVLERIADKTSLTIEFGGGVKSEEAARSVFNAGASQAVCGSVAVTDKTLTKRLFQIFGDRIILGVDFRDDKVAVHGWEKESPLSPSEVLEQYPEAGRAVCTDISRDGTLQGIDTEVYTSLQEKFPDTDIIVSGGISSADDIILLNSLSLRGVIVGKAIYEGRITLKRLEEISLMKDSHAG